MGSQNPRIRFESALPYVLMSTLSTLARAPEYEGFDQWIYVTYASLDEELRRDVGLLFKHLGALITFRELARMAEPPRDLPGFIGWLTTLDVAAVRLAVEGVLQDLACETASSGGGPRLVPRLDDRAALDDFLRRTGCEWAELARIDSRQFDLLVGLLQRPVELKARLVSGVARFWERHFSGPYAELRPTIEASAAYYDTRSAPAGGIAMLYTEVTGKPLSEDGQRILDEADEVLFIPSAFGGPYVQFQPVDSEGTVIAISYNCRTTPPSGELDRRLRSMFPPLKALADETRLEILRLLTEQELYAQQIVDRLGISQPSVSRHLALMVAGGVLRDRRSNGMKFYSVNKQLLEALGAQLSSFETRDPEVRHAIS